MTFTAASIPDLTGTVAVVTGANGGLGLETTKALVGKGAHVLMAARNRAKAEAARNELTAANPAASTKIIELDLASLDSVQEASDRILADHGRIDLLIITPV